MRGKHRVNTIGCKLAGYFKEFDPSESILIFGDPRGGSTWVTEVLANATQSSVIWEPLKTDEVATFRKLDFGYRQFIPHDHSWPQVKKAFDKVLKGELLNAHTCLGTDPMKHYKAKQLMVKICRGKALLPWLIKQYNLKFKPILLLRHPFAVVASQMQHRGWKKKFEGFFIPETPFSEQMYLAHKDFLFQLKTHEEALVATWCLSNSVALNDPETLDSCIIAFYEQLVRDPEQRFGNILSSWGFTPSLLHDIDLKVPSMSSEERTKEEDERISGWIRYFSDTKINQMKKVLDYFSVTLYNTDPMPKRSFTMLKSSE